MDSPTNVQIWLNIAGFLLTSMIGLLALAVKDAMKTQRTDHDKLDKREADNNREVLKYMADIQLQIGTQQQEVMQQIANVQLSMSNRYIDSGQYHRDQEQYNKHINELFKEIRMVREIVANKQDRS